MEKRIILDPKSISGAQAELEALFHRYIIGQDRAVRRLARRILYANSIRLRDKTKPAGTFFYLGPTGVGKTRLVEVFAKLLFGYFDAMLKIDCSELKKAHETSRLIGAPPRYVGYDRPPLLTQRRLDYWGFVTDPDISIDPKAKKELEKVISETDVLEREVYEMMDEISKIILQHHERWDGTGYPGGISGNGIRKEARILAVADSLDAMISDRPYRKALSFKSARREIMSCSGTQFDPAVVKVFSSLDEEHFRQAREQHSKGAALAA